MQYAGGVSLSFRLRYATHRALDADHGAYFTHGGMLVPWEDAKQAPEVNSAIDVIVEAPGGERFSFLARVGQLVPERGFLVSFEEESRSVLRTLDQRLEAPAFRQAIEREPAERTSEPLVLREEGPNGPNGPDGTKASSIASRENDSSGKNSALVDPIAADTVRVPTSTFHEEIDPSLDELGLDGDTDEYDLATLDRESAADDHAPRGHDSGEPEYDPILDGIEDDTAFDEDQDEDEGEDGQPSGSGGHASRRGPEPGTKYTVFAIKYPHLAEFLSAHETIERERVFHVELDRNAPGLKAGGAARLRITLPGHNLFEMWASIEEATPERAVLQLDARAPALRKLSLYCTSANARARLKNELRMDSSGPQLLITTAEVPSTTDDQMPIRRRIARMGMDDKINLALSGNREERMALAMDPNRAIHMYLLKNARITLEEIAFMARMPSTNPLVLDRIAENPSYTQNLQITKGLVYNPKTPIKTAVRLLDRLPRSEIMNISKRTQMHARLVLSAKNKLANKKW